MKVKGLISFAIAAMCLASVGCNSNKEKDTQTVVDAPDPLDSIAEIELYKGGYKMLAVKGNDSLARMFDSLYTPEQIDLILALNRVDRYGYKRIDSLVVPDEVRDDIKSFSPFPQHLELLEDVEKIVVFSYPLQAFAAYVHGKLLRWGPSSMGSKQHPTPTGLHFSNWKKEEHISTVDDEWLLKWNFNVMNFEGVGWHLYALPGVPSSHSCMRLLEEDAKYLYAFAEMWVLEGTDDVLAKGTPVLIYGAYDFEGTKPWYALATNGEANRISEQEMNNELQPHIQKIKEEQANRREVLAAQEQTGG